MSTKQISVNGVNFQYEIEKIEGQKNAFNISIKQLIEYTREEKRTRVKRIEVETLETRKDPETGETKEFPIVHFEDKTEEFIEQIPDNKLHEIGDFSIYTRLAPRQIKDQVIGYIIEKKSQWKRIKKD